MQDDSSDNFSMNSPSQNSEVRDVQEMYKQNENTTGISVYNLALDDLLKMFKADNQKDEN